MAAARLELPARFGGAADPPIGRMAAMTTNAAGRSMTMDARQWGLLLLLGGLWGGSFFLVEVALVGFGPLTVVAGRVALAAAALHAVVRATGGGLPRDAGTWATLAVMALLNNVVPFTLIVWGQTRITGSLASVLNATTPIFTVLIAHAATADERLRPGKLVGVGLGFLGALVVVGPSIVADLGGPAALAQLAVLGAAASYACAGVWGRRLRGHRPAAVAAGQLTCSAGLMVPLAWWVESVPAASPGLASAAALVTLAVLSTALAYVVYFRLLASAGATNLLLVTFLIPVAAVLLGASFLGERLSPADVAGIVLIGGGLMAIDGRPAAWIVGRVGGAA